MSYLKEQDKGGMLLLIDFQKIRYFELELYLTKWEKSIDLVSFYHVV